MNNDLKAVYSGLSMGNSLGRSLLAGISPSVVSPRGAPPPVDPLVGDFRSALAGLAGLSSKLARMKDAESLREMIEVQELSNKLERIQIDRQERIMRGGDQDQINQNQSPQPYPTDFPSVNGGGIV